jgi:hypothetical protein
MTTTINASTSSGLVMTPDNSGNVQLQYNGIAAPAFSAYKSSATALTNNTTTAIVFDTEHWDTASCYNNSTGIFTPTVAGYYQLNASVNATNDANLTQAYIAIYKNGAVFKYGNYSTSPGVNARALGNVVVSGTVYANGTTDYFQIYYNESGGVGAYGGTGVNAAWTWFDGCLLRGA